MQPWLVSFVLVVAGILAPFASGRIVPPPVAVAIIGTVGTVAFVAAFVLLWRGLRRRGAPNARALLGSGALCLAIGAAVVLLLFVPPAPAGQRFNDVTTDTGTPPMFVVGPAVGVAQPSQFVAWQRAAYPDLASLVLAVEAGAAFDHVRATAAAMPGWEIAAEDPAAGVVQALARTRLFRFEDDVVVRVTAEGAMSRVDVRSRSRFGGGDRGANAARIRAFLAALAQAR